jgi:hypothetical protein
MGDDTLHPDNLRPTEQLVVITKVRYGHVDNASTPMLSLTVTGLDCDTTVGLYQDAVDALVGPPNYIEDVFSLKNRTCIVRYESGLFRFVILFKT